MSDLNQIYQAVVRDHAANPRNRERPAEFARSAEGINPLCGDRVTLYLGADGEDAPGALHFEAAGCALVNASASLLCATCGERDRAFFEERFAAVRAMLDRSAAAVPDRFSELGDLAALGGVREFSSRHRCVLLPWETVAKVLSGGGSGNGKATPS